MYLWPEHSGSRLCSRLLELSLGLRSFGLSFLRFCLGTLGIGPRRLCLSLLGARRRT